MEQRRRIFPPGPGRGHVRGCYGGTIAVTKQGAYIIRAERRPSNADVNLTPLLQPFRAR